MQQFDTYQVVPVLSGDLAALVSLSIATFTESFSAVNTPENMQAYLEKAFQPAKQAAELQDPDSAFFFIREGKKNLGYIKLNHGNAQTEQLADTGMEIERIYILKEAQGKGLGQVLLDFAVDQARLAGQKGIWLGVWEENKGAIRFYERNGFVPFDKHIFYLGDDPQTDILMRKSL